MKHKLTKEVRNLVISFGLLYLTIFFSIYALQALKNIQKGGPFLLVSTHQPGILEKEGCVPSRKRDSVIIPDIKVEAPVVSPDPEDNLTKALNKGVVLYPEADTPEQKGTVILLGHSAPPGWPRIKYDWVFSDIKELEKGDEIELVYNRCGYTFEVKTKRVLEKAAKVPAPLTKGEKKSLILISCWPPGKDYKRMAVSAELVLAENEGRD